MQLILDQFGRPSAKPKKILKKMVAGNKMDLSLTATELQKLHPEFMKFSTDVFRVHLRKVAGKTGEHCELS